MGKNEFLAKRRARVDRLLKDREVAYLPHSSLVIMDDDGINHDADAERVDEEILKNGLLQPITVAGPYDDNTYLVIDGARRVKSLAFAKNDIPCYVIGGKEITHKEAIELAISANKIHRSSDVALKMRYVEYVYDQSALGLVDRPHLGEIIAEGTSMTPRMAREYIRVVEEGSDELKEAVSQSDISVEDANRIISVEKSDEGQKKWLDKFKNAKWGSKNAIKNELKSNYSEKALVQGVRAEISGGNAKIAIVKQADKERDAVIERLINDISDLCKLRKTSIHKSALFVEMIDAFLKLGKKIA